MKYDPSVYEAAEREIKLRRSSAEKSKEKRHAEVEAKFPELLLIEREMALCGLETAKALGMGKDAPQFIEALKNKNLAAQERRRELLRSGGYPDDYLAPHYTCPECNDTGVSGGRMCTCFKQLLKAISYERLSKTSPLTVSRFEDFDLSYYPEEACGTGPVPRRMMENIFRYCKSYASGFSKKSPSLLLYGATGLGKTHLSLAVAGKVTEKGFGVIYGSAQNLLNRIENEKFGRTWGEQANTMDMLLECDLLILDDLGAEFSTAFTVSAIYNIINSRMLTGLPTIINTNLDPGELSDKYGERIASRILGSFTPLYFCGRDIRQIKG